MEMLPGYGMPGSNETAVALRSCKSEQEYILCMYLQHEYAYTMCVYNRLKGGRICALMLLYIRFKTPGTHTSRITSALYPD